MNASLSIVMAGGSGFVGERITKRLVAAGHHVTILSRNVSHTSGAAPAGVEVVRWDGKNRGDWEYHIAKADAVLNFAGASIAGGRWTSSRRKRILSSRLEPTRALVDAIGRSGKKPGTLISASAVGYYGSLPDGDATEETPRGEGFMADVCARFEEGAGKAADYGVRTLMLRMGVVLDRDGGVFDKLLPAFRLGVGGPLGTGRQWFSWIHHEDLTSGILHILHHPEIGGPVNATAPYPIRMQELAEALGRILHRPSFMRVPAPFLRLLLGEMSDTILTGQRALPARLVASGFRFAYQDIESALHQLFSRN